MDKIKKIILCAIPTSICNLRCHYCYLSQRGEAYQGEQAQFLYLPEYVGRAFSKERLGGVCFFNFCADGETLLTKDIDQYMRSVVEQGHYAEIVTNLTVTKVLEKILAWRPDLLKRVTFKCSFHYLELLRKGMLDVFADNVHKIWRAGASANIEITPDDELVPYIDAVKEFSLREFGALPHLSIARNDATAGIEYLTDMSMEEYDRTWSQFGSSFWEFKKTIFKVMRNEYCYAGAWSLYVNFATGDAVQCYCSRLSQNIYRDMGKRIRFVPIGRCSNAHCYNGHALLTLGCIPGFTKVGYGDIRDRVKADGSPWLQPEMRDFLNGKLEESNEQHGTLRKKMTEAFYIGQRLGRGAERLRAGKKRT